jgi:hypothetical protein
VTEQSKFYTEREKEREREQKQSNNDKMFLRENVNTVQMKWGCCEIYRLYMACKEKNKALYGLLHCTSSEQCDPGEVLPSQRKGK